MQRLSGTRDPWVLAAAALVTRAAAAGHVCLDLDLSTRRGIQAADGQDALAVELSGDEWCERLSDCPAVGRPGDFKPLILDRPRLYLHRYWQYEQELAAELRRRCNSQTGLPIAPEARETALSRDFTDSPEQLQAARLVLTRPFSVISGGPGTGKTFTLAKIILLLNSLFGNETLRIKLAAPTGKAAARLQESLQAAMARLHPDDSRPLELGAEAQTIHRLLGIVPDRAAARYDAERPLPAEVIIVDEASMIDLAMMVKLLRAVPPQAHLVLTGDKDQLASVEAGAVLGDICRALTNGGRSNMASTGRAMDRGSPPAPVALLNKSYRFDSIGGIGALSRSINAGDGLRVRRLLAETESAAIGLAPVANVADLQAVLESEVLAAYGPMGEMDDPAEALEQLRRFKILAVVRNGAWGVEGLNQWIQDLLHRRGLIRRMPGMTEWHSGQPVMVTRNDYFHNLYNGDSGIAVRAADRSDQGLEIAFEHGGGMIRRLKPHELPAHETVYAMTVHKSQGSEFGRVILVLPDRDIPLLTRELIYTAVTRARESVLIAGLPELLEAGVQRRIERASGLEKALGRFD